MAKVSGIFLASPPLSSHKPRAGAQDDAGDGEEQDALDHQMVGDEVECGHPAEMAHQRDRGDDVAELAHAGIGEQALHVVLLQRHHRAGDGRQQADPAHHMREFQPDLGADGEIGDR